MFCNLLITLGIESIGNVSFRISLKIKKQSIKHMRGLCFLYTYITHTETNWKCLQLTVLQNVSGSYLSNSIFMDSETSCKFICASPKYCSGDILSSLLRIVQSLSYPRTWFWRISVNPQLSSDLFDGCGYVRSTDPSPNSKTYLNHRNIDRFGM